MTCLQSISVCLVRQINLKVDHQWQPVNRKSPVTLSQGIKSCSKLLLSRRTELYPHKPHTLLSSTSINLFRIKSCHLLIPMKLTSDTLGIIFKAFLINTSILFTQNISRSPKPSLPRARSQAHPQTPTQRSLYFSASDRPNSAHAL